MAAKRLKVTVKLKSPLLVTRQQVGFVWESERFVPGSALRGAVAQVLLKEGTDDSTLAALFAGPHAPRFGHAYPGLEPEDKAPVGVLPHTAHSCKRHGGFCRDEEDKARDERHGVYDWVIPQIVGQMGREARCPVCEKGADPWGGWPYVLLRVDGNETRYVSPRVITRRMGRTAIARQRAAVAEGLLYTLEVIGTQLEADELDDQGRPRKGKTTFHGYVWIERNGFSWEEAIECVSHLGGGVSRGLGWVDVDVKESSVPLPNDDEWTRAAHELAAGTASEVPPERLGRDENLIKRVLAFNRLIRQQAGSKMDQWYFTLDLQADAILSNVHGPLYQLDVGDLGLLAPVERVFSFAGYTQAGGWSAAWGLPKPVEPAVTLGSVFVFQVPLGDEILARQVLDRLVELEQEGIGRRCQEGYGWLHVCTPFHLEVPPL